MFRHSRDSGVSFRGARSRGFTLVELMMVVAIVAVLAALAVPAYTDYTIRTKVTECINLMGASKVQISEFYQSEARWPATASEAGIELTEEIIEEGLTDYCWIETYIADSGTIVVFIDGPGIGASLSRLDILPFLSPAANAGGSVEWECTRGATTDVALRFLPSSCRDDNII